MVNKVNTERDNNTNNSTDQGNKYYHTRFVYSKRVNRHNVQGLMVRSLNQTFAVFSNNKAKSACQSYADVVKKNAPPTGKQCVNEPKVEFQTQDDKVKN